MILINISTTTFKMCQFSVLFYFTRDKIYITNAVIKFIFTLWVW